MQFQGTGWRCKRFQGTVWRRKRSKNRSKQQSKGSYLSYQRIFSTQSIGEQWNPSDHPRYHPSGSPIQRGWGFYMLRGFACSTYGSLGGDCHGRGAQHCACFQRPYGGKLEGCEPADSNWYEHFWSNPHSHYSSSDWYWDLRVPNPHKAPVDWQFKGVHRPSKIQERTSIQNLH